MSKGGIIGRLANLYTTRGPSPWATAALLGLGVYGTGRLGWGATIETLRSLGRPIAAKMGDDPAQARAVWDMKMDEYKNDSIKKRRIPAAAGILTTLATLGYLYTPNQEYKGLAQWYPEMHPIPKRASFDPYMQNQSIGMNSYVNELDWNRPIHASNVIGLFKNDPHLQDEPYARNMGISIVADAAATQHTKTPTLGGIFDSAVNKIENKLSFGGLMDVAVKTTVANGISRLFASSLGAMCDLSPVAQQKLVDAGTWAGAVTAMLN